jgi:putative RNA 2'-phosphotransferase
MINDKQIKHISKFLSYVLRHHPETIGIQLDKNGWTDIDELLEKADNYGIQFDRDQLNHIVATNAKKRFTFNETLDKIRANQGHSIEVELGYSTQKPPEILFHGTGEKSVQSILETGLEKRSRQQVHLSADIETAIRVGQRHGKPFVFKVLAEQMYNNKFEFFISDNGVWLTDHVPAKYLKSNDD